MLNRRLTWSDFLFKKSFCLLCGKVILAGKGKQGDQLGAIVVVQEREDSALKQDMKEEM